jgi:hypothetical protein
MTTMEMTTNLEQLPKKILANLDDLCQDYLLYIINHMEILRFRPWDSQIQYLVTDTHRIHLNQAVDTYKALQKLNIDFSKTLNVGTGGGYFEYVCKHFNTLIDTVEYEDDRLITDGVRSFRVLRKYFNIDLTYKMSSILKDNFKIYDCNKKYDYIILFRFLYHSTTEQNQIVDYKKTYDILNKLSKYADNVIIIGRKEFLSFKHFKSVKEVDLHQYANIKEILAELKTKLL